jgi:hypothetical protein
MSFITSITIGLLSLLGSLPNEEDCTKMRSGTFTYGDAKNPVTVEIVGDKHVEYHNKDKYVIESVMKWTGDCEYGLTMTRVTIPNFPYKPGDVLKTVIVKVEGEKIYYTSSVHDTTWKGVFIKVK